MAEPDPFAVAELLLRLGPLNRSLRDAVERRARRTDRVHGNAGALYLTDVKARMLIDELELPVDAPEPAEPWVLAPEEKASLIVLRGTNATGVVIGECSSAAIWLLAACKKRIVTPHSVLLFHPLKWESGGTSAAASLNVGTPCFLPSATHCSRPMRPRFWAKFEK